MYYIDIFPIQRANPPYKMPPLCDLVIQPHLDYSYKHDTVDSSVPRKHSTVTKQSRLLYASVGIATSYCAESETYQTFSKEIFIFVVWKLNKTVV
jgi:hypothetical protein